ncbi:peptidase M, partial [Trifolium medium]|nr:peptidase M [Trifolium medium]
MNALCFFLVLLATMHGIQAVDYSVTNNALSTPGVLYHEMTHVWQWNGNGQANGGLIE